MGRWSLWHLLGFVCIVIAFFTAAISRQWLFSSLLWLVAALAFEHLDLPVGPRTP